MTISFDLKQQMIPVKVPWEVSPSTPFLRLTAFESASDNPTEVVFVAHFGLSHQLKESKNQMATGYEIAMAVNSPYDSGVDLSDEEGPYRIVKLTFQNGVWSRMSPSYSDRAVLDPTIYDFTAIPFPYESNQNIDDWLASFQQEWVKTSFCPDPRMYEIKNSAWIHQTKSRKSGYKHYLILGHDAFVEVLAKGWEWRADGTLKNW